MTDKTFVTFVLDETGSMESIKDDTIGGFNAYLQTLKEHDGEIAFTLIKFDSNRQEIVHRAVPVDKVPSLTPDTYLPGAMTPLVDACCKAIKATSEKAPADAKVAIVIQTDGIENASLEYTNRDLARLVKEKTAQGWMFTFLGAGIDAFSQANEFGISRADTLHYARHKTAAGFAAAADKTRHYSQTGKSRPFTSRERRRAKALQDSEPESLVDDIKI